MVIQSDPPEPRPKRVMSPIRVAMRDVAEAKKQLTHIRLQKERLEEKRTALDLAEDTAVDVLGEAKRKYDQLLGV